MCSLVKKKKGKKSFFREISRASLVDSQKTRKWKKFQDYPQWTKEHQKFPNYPKMTKIPLSGSRKAKVTQKIQNTQESSRKLPSESKSSRKLPSEPETTK